MKPFLAVLIFFFLVFLVLLVHAADPAPQCVPEQIEVQKLKQENARLLQQLMQAQFAVSQQASDAAKAEQARLEALLPKKPDPNPKQSSAVEKK